MQMLRDKGSLPAGLTKIAIVEENNVRRKKKRQPHDKSERDSRVLDKRDIRPSSESENRTPERERHPVDELERYFCSDEETRRKTRRCGKQKKRCASRFDAERKSVARKCGAGRKIGAL